MSYLEVRRTADRVRAIPLEAVLVALDAEHDAHDRAKWHTRRGVLSVTGAKFMNWNLSASGGGAIDLAIHLLGLDFLSTVAWLESRFPAARTTDTTAEGRTGPGGRRLELPRRAPQKAHLVTDYLVHERGLPLPVVKLFIDAGDIYADERANAVFLMYSADGPAVGAEIRGTGRRPFHGMAKGSRKNLGSFTVPAPGSRKVVLCESAIDALSCHVLHPDSTCLSTAGARPDPAWLRPLRIDHRVYCGFDSDETGDAMARTMIALHPDVKRLRPPLKDWNEVLRPRPQPPDRRTPPDQASTTAALPRNELQTTWKERCPTCCGRLDHSNRAETGQIS